MATGEPFKSEEHTSKEDRFTCPSEQESMCVGGEGPEPNVFGFPSEVVQDPLSKSQYEQPSTHMEGRAGVKRRHDEEDGAEYQQILQLTKAKYDNMLQTINERRKKQLPLSRGVFLRSILMQLQEVVCPPQKRHLSSNDFYLELKEEDSHPAKAEAATSSPYTPHVPHDATSYSPLHSAQYVYPSQYHNTTSQAGNYQYDTTSNQYQDTTVNCPYQNPAVTSTYQNAAATSTYQDAAVTSTYQDLTVASPYQNTTASSTYQDPAIGSPYENTSVSSAYSNMSVSSPYEHAAGSSSFQITDNSYQNTTSNSTCQNTTSSSNVSFLSTPDQSLANSLSENTCVSSIGSTSSIGEAMCVSSSSEGSMNSVSETMDDSPPVNSNVTTWSGFSSLMGPAGLAPMWEEPDNSTMLPPISSYMSNDQFDYVWNILATAAS